MNATIRRSLGVAVAVAAPLWVLHLLGVGLWLLLTLAGIFALVAWATPWIGVRWLDRILLAGRTLLWWREEGRFHSFAGVPLRIDDDGRHVWVDGEGLQRVLGRREPEPALAARHAGHWRRTDEGVLMLRVDAVVRHLNTMPGREAPRVQRLRRYFEREVLFPAGRRRDVR
jgi:hypothetical protein